MSLARWRDVSNTASEAIGSGVVKGTLGVLSWDGTSHIIAGGKNFQQNMLKNIVVSSDILL